MATVDTKRLAVLLMLLYGIQVSLIAVVTLLGGIFLGNWSTNLESLLMLMLGVLWVVYPKQQFPDSFWEYASRTDDHPKDA